MKRVVDVVCSLVGLVVCLPLLAVAAIAIRLESDGPIIFRQQRVGRGGSIFTIMKLRTMTATAHGRSLTVGADRRVTKVGHVLRAAKIDELPQLLNVIAGSMSIVGYRPEIPCYVALCSPAYTPLLSYRPGLTDPASIAYIKEASLLSGAVDPEAMYIEEILPRKIALSLAYAQTATWKSDVGIIARTFTHLFDRASHSSGDDQS